MKASIIASTLLLLLPWTLASFRYFEKSSFLERLAFGVTGGLAASITLGYLLATFGLLDFYWAVHSLLVVIALVIWWTRPASLIPRESGLAASLFVLAGIVALYAIPTFSLRFPPGWDPAFHSILAQKVMNSGAVASDWLPFENVAVNYTQGVHVLIAIISRWSRSPVHEVFVVLHLIVQAIAVLQVGILGRQIFDDARMQPVSMIVYGLLAHLGSFSSYFEWGGLPTELGALFLLSIVSAAIRAERRASIGIMVLFFGSLTITHHLSALIATSVLLSYIILSYGTSRESALAGRLLKMLVLTAVVYSFHLVPYGMRIATIGATDTLRYAQDTMKSLGDVIGDLGIVVVALAVVGFLVSSRQSAALPEGAKEKQEFLLSWLATLVFAFAILGYAWRYLVWLRTGDNVAPFTPSRWITLAAYPLALYAARSLTAFLDMMRSSLGKRMPRVERWSVLLLFAGAATIATPRMLQLARHEPVTPETENAFRQAGTLTPGNALLVLDAGSAMAMRSREWLPYLSWRSSLYTPLPASEDQTTLNVKRQTFGSGDRKRIFAWLESNDLDPWAIQIDSSGVTRAMRIGENPP